MSAPHSLPPLADPEVFVKAMGKIHRRLVEDLRTRAVDPRVEPSLREAWTADKKQGRTGESFETYRDAFCDQVGASWVLCTVFARTLEDRGYLPHRLAGPGAIERQTMFRSAFKFLGERDYLLHIFDGISLLPGAREVFGPGHAALWRLGPTSRALGELLDELGAMENGQLRFTFGKEKGSIDESGASTRYLGDLYQNLNEDVRKRYALLQTPDFVERFLLDNTLNPAIRERGCAVTVLDPACGSGHLLLGAYDRLFGARLRDEPGRPLHETAKLALGQVFGIDLNPYAAAVARFRLLLSYLDKAGITRLQDAPLDVPLQVYVGDSLLAGRSELQTGLGDLFANADAGFERSPVYSLFNSEADKLLYKTKFDVVVANPPYITEKDATKRELIRKHYKAAAGKYALSAPFAERIFQLGNAGAYTGQITANSFMKREFGKALVEQVFPSWELTHVIDTSGAFIPGHGTPTVILFGRSQKTTRTKAAVVMVIRGEPGIPDDPSKGKSWSSITNHYRDIGFENEFISVSEIEREKLGKHPWSIGGGGAADLKELLEEKAISKLRNLVASIGFMAITGEDEAFSAPPHALRNSGIVDPWIRDIGTGDAIRDWSIALDSSIIFPYAHGSLPTWASLPLPIRQWLWPRKRILLNRPDFSGKKYRDVGRTAHEYHQIPLERLRSPLAIAYAEIATHNHFMLDRGGKVYKQTAPIIKLKEEATEDEHLKLLGYLNSSTACFWLSQTCQPKTMGNASGANATPFLVRRQYNAGTLSDLPVPLEKRSRMLGLVRDLDRIGRETSDSQIMQVLEREFDNASALLALWRKEEDKRRRLRETGIQRQELLDWLVYELFGLIPDGFIERWINSDFPLRLGQRPFERYWLARRDPLIHEWADWHGFSLNPAEPLEGVATDFVHEALDLIARIPEIRMLEHPCYKRRWIQPRGKAATELETDDKVFRDMLPEWLLTRAETFYQSRDPRPLPIRTIAAELHRDPKVRAVAEVLTGSANVDLEALLADLFQQDALASATCQIYSDEGIETRRAWENVWELQRREDAGEKLDIEPPPKYDQKDFENATTVWRLRGKLDVPKERFIAYPTATPPPGASGKPGLVFGWAGWDALQKLQAVIELWQEEMGLHGHEILPRATRGQLVESAPTDEKLTRDSITRQKLAPILQTMVDLLPWVKQWHDEDGQTASAFEAYIAEEARKLEMTLEEAHLYRRPAKSAAPKGRKTAATKKATPEPTATKAIEEKPAKKPRGRKPKAAEGDI